MTEVVKCPVCGNTTFTDLITCKDHTVSHETFGIKSCADCGLGITKNIPSNIEKYYDSSEYISHSETSSGIGKLYRSARSYSIKWKLSLIKIHSRSLKILDFGCGTGSFITELAKNEIKVAGVEPSKIAREKINPSIPVYESIENLNENEFDCITLWHVLEHVNNLDDTLQKLVNKLTSEGTLFIAVPNPESPDAIHYKNYWAGYDVPRHIWHFNKNAMSKLLAKHGLEIVHIQPMLLDAFYVSMLSEKYKSGKMNMLTILRGAFFGLLSNIKAFSKKNHSSLIYIARR